MVVLRLLCFALLALLAADCGGGSDSPPPPAPGVHRLSQGLQDIVEGTEVGVRQVLTKARPPKALLSLTDVGLLGSMQQVELAVGESTEIGSQRFVLVGVGKGGKKPYVDFRLEPLPDK